MGIPQDSSEDESSRHYPLQRDSDAIRGVRLYKHSFRITNATLTIAFLLFFQEPSGLGRTPANRDGWNADRSGQRLGRPLPPLYDRPWTATQTPEVPRPADEM